MTKGIKSFAKLTVGLLVFSLVFTESTLAQADPCDLTVSAGEDVTIPCEGSIEIGNEPETVVTEPDFELAPTCEKTAMSQNGPLTQGGGIYNNGVVTTGGTTNINNTNTLVDVTNTNPMGPDAWQTLWYSDFTNHVVEVCPGDAFGITINAKSLYQNSPYFCQIWVDWNNDGQFTADEVVHNSGPYTTNNFTVNGNITVPGGQADGAFRMRIRFKDNAPFVLSDNGDGCTFQNSVGIPPGYAGYTGSNYGNYYFSDEVEDYTVKVDCNTTTTPTGDVTYSWTPADGLSDPTSPNPIATPGSTTTYTVTMTDTETGCTATDQVTVTIAGNLEPTFNNPGPICIGDEFTLPTTSNEGVEGTWSPAINNTETTTYTFTPTNSTCTDEVEMTVIVNENPAYTADVTDETCNMSNGEIEVDATGGLPPYNYGLNGEDFSGNNVFGDLVNGNYGVTVIDGNGCQVNGNEIVGTTATPNIENIATTEPTCNGICDGTIAITVNGGEAPYTFAWTLNGTALIEDTDNIQDACVGTYTVTVTDNNGCFVTETITLTEPNTANPEFTLTNYCEGEMNFASNISPIGGMFSFNPAVTDGATINPNTGTITNGVGGTTYTVEYAIGGGDCAFFITQEVTVFKKPIPEFVGDELTGCEPHTVNFTNNSINSAGDCVWTFGDGTTVNDCGQKVSHTYNNAGYYSVGLTITSPEGCSATYNINNYIHVTTPPVASFSADNMVVQTSNTEVNFTNETSNGVDYTWTFGDDSPAEHTFNASHDFPNEEFGEYVVKLVASNGPNCSDTARMLIKVEEELIFWVPNAFTPDDDIYNPFFAPVFTSGYDPQSYTLLIFNRWGEIVFESHNVDAGWDGTYGGKYAQDGTYVWKIQIKEAGRDKHNEYVGHLTLIR